MGCHSETSYGCAFEESFAHFIRRGSMRLMYRNLGCKKGELYLKGLDDTPQPNSKAGARWIVVKVHDLNKTSTYIYYLCVCTLIVVNF